MPKSVSRTIALGLALALGSALPAPATGGDDRTERVSLGPDGEQASHDSGFFGPSVSTDGRFVAFDSFAGNLTPDDTNGTLDIFVRDRLAGITERVSLPRKGAEGDGSGIGRPAISADGRFVAFYSSSNSLVPDDTNAGHDVFVRDRRAARTERVSVATGGAQGNGDDGFGGVAISADGRFVAFRSFDEGLVPGDTNRAPDIFVRDRRAGTTERVSVGPGGAQANEGSGQPSVSADGRFVAFASDATNLVPGDTNGVTDVFVRDRRAGTTERVSVGRRGVQGDAGSSEPSISADGRYVALASAATNLAPGDTNELPDVFVRDRGAGRTERVSIATGGAQNDGNSSGPAISANGRIIAFRSTDGSLVQGDTNEAPDVFVHNRGTGRTKRVSVGPRGVQGDSISFEPSISGDGRFVAFGSDAANLVPGDTNRAFDVFVRNRGP